MQRLEPCLYACTCGAVARLASEVTSAGQVAAPIAPPKRAA
jgi:hypothetical protein